MDRSTPEQWFFEDFVIGQRFQLATRTIAEEDFLTFATLSGDAHPIHYDDAYARQSRFGRRVAHGLLLIGMTALGASELSRHLHDSMVAFVEVSARFLKPVFIGDFIAVEGIVTELTPKREVGLVRLALEMRNQHGERALEGWHSYLIKRKTGATVA